ncbi:MAG: phosphodiesterase [Rhodobacteraceae bacterium]|nr:phosphodiesterase [Paracoccaceae bacterium]
MSDLHFNADGLVLGHDPKVRLRAAVDFVTRHLADADHCLITGDLVEDATDENYRALARELARLPMPICPLPGNHDDRGMMARLLDLPRPVMSDYVQYAMDLGDAVLLCLDTLVPGQDYGELCKARLAWLHDQLRNAAGRTVLVAMHHPPVTLGLPMLDPDNLRNGSAVLDLLAAHDGNVQILAGHVHRPASAVTGKIPIRTIRSILYQAPPPVPDWDWDSFLPAREAPNLAVVTVQKTQITIQDLEFCLFETGGALP